MDFLHRKNIRILYFVSFSKDIIRIIMHSDIRTCRYLYVYTVKFKCTLAIQEYNKIKNSKFYEQKKTFKLLDL